MSVLDLINFSQKNVQDFSLPNPLINCIFDNSSTIVSQKLIQSCKIFKLIHLKKNESKFEKMTVSLAGYEIIAGSCVAKSRATIEDFRRFKISSEMKSIKVMHSFMLLSLRDCDYYLKNLMPKLNLYQTKEIDIEINVELKSDILENILNPSLEILNLNCFSTKDVNPALLAFQRCPKLKEIELVLFLRKLTYPPFYRLWFKDYPSIPVLTKNILKEMVVTKRKNKIERIYFVGVTEVDYQDFINLIENHLDQNCVVFLLIKVEEIFNEYQRMFAKIRKLRKKHLKNGIQVNFGFEGFSNRASF